MRQCRLSGIFRENRHSSVGTEVYIWPKLIGNAIEDVVDFGPSQTLVWIAKCNFLGTSVGQLGGKLRHGHTIVTSDGL